jgi:hypothetical protein
MLRTVLCILALGIDTTGAFQAPARSGWTQTAPLMSMPYSPGAETGQKVRRSVLSVLRCYAVLLRHRLKYSHQTRAHNAVDLVSLKFCGHVPPYPYTHTSSPTPHTRPFPSLDILAGGMEPAAGE